MNTTHSTTPVSTLLVAVAGARRAASLLATLEVPEALASGAPGLVSRGQLSMALAALLFEDVMARVPMGRAYARDAVRAGRKLVFDHGALRTVAAPSGALPAGERAFARILEPLGYERAATYPLDRIGMTGRAWRHRDLPAAIPQYFVSELHPERFSPEFEAAVQRVVGSSRDPLPARASALLIKLGREGALPIEHAIALLPDLVACFDRQHDEPTERDYELLLAESEEMAWIATEGHSFNHATDRVADVRAVAEEQRRMGRPIKATVEVSASGRVLQTAFRAAPVERLFVGDDGCLVARTVPGSFHEFISRQALEDGSLDLAFDAANAQGIFAMTRKGGAA